jgi:trigger factor
VKVSLEKLPTSEAVLSVDLSWDEMEKASNKAYKKLVKQIDVQGFRRGKAPRSLLERKVGKESIYQEGLDDLITETYRKAIKEHDLTPISQPKLDAPIFEMGQPYHFSLTIPILIPAELIDYKSLHFEREDVSVTSEEVDKEIQALRERQTEWKAVDRPIEYNDRIKADLKLTSGDQQISDLKESTFEITTERHGIFSGMDEHLLGFKAGDTKEFSTTIPADYSNAKLAGQKADFVVTIHTVEVKELPELDDAFAAKVSDGACGTIEDLSKTLSDTILERKKRHADTELREKILNTIIEQSHVVIHPTLIQDEIEEMIHHFDHMLQQQHLSTEQYLKLVGKNLEQYKEEISPDAEKRVKRQLVLDEIARKEQIAVMQEEIEALFNAYAQMGQELPKTEEQIRSLALNYRREKTLIRLVELTTNPDPNAEKEAQAEKEEQVEKSMVNAEAAALAGETAVEQAESGPESATATPLPQESKTETVE